METAQVPRSYDSLPRRTPASPASTATKTAILNAVYQVIDPAISPCETAPGKMSGIVHAQSSFTSKSTITAYTAISARTPVIVIHHVLFIGSRLLLYNSGISEVAQRVICQRPSTAKPHAADMLCCMKCAKNHSKILLIHNGKNISFLFSASSLPILQSMFTLYSISANITLVIDFSTGFIRISYALSGIFPFS